MRSRVVSFLTWPPFALAAYAATHRRTHLTGLMNLVRRIRRCTTPSTRCTSCVGYLFFLPILGP